MPTEPGVPTLAEIVHRAVTVCDPEGDDEALARLLERFDDRDEPVTTELDMEATMVEAANAVDPQTDDPAVLMAAAVATYLAHRRTQIPSGRTEILRLAARAEFEGSPPPAVAGWLAAEGIEA